MSTDNEAIQAFSHYESGVFLGWIEAVGDVMLNRGEVADSVTAENLGGLLMALSRAANELQQRELEQARERQPR